ncbi:unnamed protein product [Larinioides sclopetarius]|uniref:Major facilitator superfamily (MFS) profile domain-containing protein n=1 Tax=Larinioides sclopetarius TaxID=280406 RepID=A0AAV2BA50_9ARAC
MIGVIQRIDFIPELKSELLTGPLIGYLGDKFGLKTVIILGCLLSSVVVGGCFFAEDIVTITILWGVAFGKNVI